MAESNLNLHSKAYRTATWVSAVLIIGFGIYLSSIQFMNSEWLSRAGCLIVMLGIWSGVSGLLQERLIISRLKKRRRNALTEAKARLNEEGNNIENPENKLSEINESFDNQVEETKQNLRLSIGVLEVSLLLTGTFLWGFGDLLVR